MQTSHFQLGLIATLAVGLGFSLSSSDAIGYPAGAAVSYGSNPVVSAGGSVYAGAGSRVLLTAPSDQDLVLTDVVLTSFSDSSCKRSHHSSLTLDSGDIVAQFETSSPYAQRYHEYASSTGLSVQHHFGSGLIVPTGQSVTIDVSQTDSFGSCGTEHSFGVRYAVSGYHAQP
jgi:hypothetical protein